MKAIYKCIFTVGIVLAFGSRGEARFCDSSKRTSLSNLISYCNAQIFACTTPNQYYGGVTTILTSGSLPQSGQPYINIFCYRTYCDSAAFYPTNLLANVAVTTGCQGSLKAGKATPKVQHPVGYYNRGNSPSCRWSELYHKWSGDDLWNSYGLGIFIHDGFRYSSRWAH